MQSTKSAICIISESDDPNIPKKILFWIASKKDKLNATFDSCDEDIAKESHKISVFVKSGVNRFVND